MEERIDKNELLDNGHWTDEWYAQRITAKQWRALLLQNDDKIKVFLGGIKSSGVGITLTAASHVIFIDYSWVPADHIQAQDRAHRIGSEHSKINIIQLFCKETIDDYMKEMLEKKQELFNQLINPSDDADKDEGKNQLNVMSGVVKIIEGKHVDK